VSTASLYRLPSLKKSSQKFIVFDIKNNNNANNKFDNK